MNKLEKNQVYRGRIEGYASDGSGIARIEGMAVFVKGTIRDELVDIFIEHIGHNAAWGHVVKQIQFSPARHESDCPYDEVCGGCQFRHMSYEEELSAKGQRVNDSLRRVGGLDLQIDRIWGAHHTSRYRNKIQLPVSDSSIGYYQERTHLVVDIEDCMLQPEHAAIYRKAILTWMKDCGVPAYQEKSHKGLVRHLYLRFNQVGETLCCLVVNGKSIPQPERLVELLCKADDRLVGIVLSINTRKTNVILGTEFVTLWGRDWLEEQLCGLTFRLSVPSFFQINRDQTELLYHRAIEFAQLTGSETVLDLYCGIGTISLCLAQHCAQVIGGEIIPQAIEDAKANALRNGITNATFFCGDAAQIATKLQQEGLQPDVITVDPPRKGLSPEVPAILTSMAPKRIVYVSCDPATLSRDLKRFEELGYRAVRAEAVDLFPRTAHVETVCLLTHKD